MTIQLEVAARGADGKPLPIINAITFGGGYNLPMWVAQRQSFFTKHGIAFNLELTPNSVFLMTSLIEGKFDLAIAGTDNLIAYQEGQGEVAVEGDFDLAAFMGLDNGLLHLMAAPDVRSLADLRGKQLSVDALGTGFAFVLREMIVRGGLKESEVSYVKVGGTPIRFRALLEGKQSATLLPTPFDLQAEEQGYRRLGSAQQLLGRYMGRSAFAQRSWIKANEPAAIGFLRAYKDAMEWIFDAKNRAIAEALLIANDAEMTPALARRTYDVFVDPKEGFFRDLALDVEGLRTLLRLRRKYATPAKPLDDPMKYIDLELFRKAFPGAAESSR
jgi:ABC-type nitrate/sulfonate/bicarbonate transport system substrate-binding protein